MMTIIWRLLILVSLIVVSAHPSQASKNLIVDLSKPSIDIATDFIGEKLIIFGSTLGQGEVIIVVRGPERSEVVRRKQKIAGIWVNKDSIEFNSVPYFYAVSSTSSLKKILPDEILIEKQIGIDHIEYNMKWNFLKSTDMLEFKEALIRNKIKSKLFHKRLENITFLGHQLFRNNIHFPSNVIPGTYQIVTYLVQNKKIKSRKINKLIVRKVGIESSVYNFAHEKPYYYGILAIIISAIAGWLISIFFRKT